MYVVVFCTFNQHFTFCNGSNNSSHHPFSSCVPIFRFCFFFLLCYAQLVFDCDCITKSSRVYLQKKQKYGAFFSRLFSIVLNSVWCLRTVVVSYNNSILKQIFICGFYLSWFSLVLMVFLVLLNAFTMFY